MTTVTDRNGRRTLDLTARRWGYADFDTYIRAGGGVIEAYELLMAELAGIKEAVEALKRIHAPNWNEKLAEAECEATGEPVAALQGDEA